MPGLHNLIKISADVNGQAPKTIEILKCGSWNTPWHGDFEITPDDIHQFVANAKSSVGLVTSDPKIPINYGHASSDKAAGWIDPQAGQLYASEDGQTLIGEPQWTPAASKAISDKEWSYLSPEFNPRSVPWEDPEERTSFTDNVLTGAALTNIPLFKKLKPVQASRLAGSSDKPKQPKGEDMDLATVRAKEVKDLTDEEKTFLSEHKAELTAEELTKFELGDDAQAKADAEELAKAQADKEAADKATEDAKAAEAEAVKVDASRKAVSISADRLAKLEADAKRGVEAAAKLAHNEASAFASAAVKAGRIKSEQVDALVSRVVKASKAEAEFLKSFVEGLPKNEQLGKESGVSASATGSAQETVFAKARDIVAADSKVTFQNAVLQVLKADRTLAAEFDKVNNSKEGK